MKHTAINFLGILFVALIINVKPGSAAEELTVILDWFVNPDHAPLIVAREAGFFSEVGLEVELIAPANPNDPPKLVAAGKADLAISYQPQLHLQVDQGLPLTRIATVVASPLTTLIVLPGGPIAKLADLKGRRIGYSVAFYKDLLLPAMLARHGLTLEDVDTVAVSFALSQSLLAGRVDATIGAFRNFELNQMALVGQEGRAFFPEEEGVPAYDELIVVANTASLGDSRLPGFLEALERGVLYLVNHPEESWRLFIGANPALDDELNRRAWRDTLPRFALRPAALDGHRYDRFARFLHAQGLIARVPPVADYARDVR